MSVTTFQTTSLTTDLATLEQIVRSCCSILENAKITLDQEGLFIRDMDNSHVSLLDMRLPTSIFEKWNVSKETSFSFDTDQFLKIVRSLNKKQSVNIEVFEDRLKISQIDSMTALKITSEENRSDCPLPKIPFDSTIKSTSKEIKNTFKKIESISDYVTIEIIDSKCVISGKGDQGENIQTLNKEIFEIISKNDSISTYSFEYLTPFLKSVQKDQELEINFSSRKPCKISTKLNNLGMIDFYIAPRVEN